MKFLKIFSVLIIVLTTTSVTSNSKALEKYGANFYPPEGKIIHIAGQMRDDFLDYVENVSCNGKKCPMPAGAAAYSNLELTGLKAPHSWSPGETQDMASLDKKFEDLVFQLAIWLDKNHLKGIGDGKCDYKIEGLAEILKSYKRPAYLRIGYEFDNQWQKFEPEDYKKAYRRIVKVLSKEGVKNVSYVWHSYGMCPTYQYRDIMDWYPGDAYVNWIGMSMFQISRKQIAATGCYTGHNWSRILEIAREKNIPVMICESSAIRVTPSEKSKTGQEYWDYWYKPYFEFIESNPEVKAFSIINCDWDSIHAYKSIKWGDCRIKKDAIVLEEWRIKMHDNKYLHSSDKLYKSLNYVP